MRISREMDRTGFARIVAASTVTARNGSYVLPWPFAVSVIGCLSVGLWLLIFRLLKFLIGF